MDGAEGNDEWGVASRVILPHTGATLLVLDPLEWIQRFFGEVLLVAAVRLCSSFCLGKEPLRRLVREE